MADEGFTLGPPVPKASPARQNDGFTLGPPVPKAPSMRQGEYGSAIEREALADVPGLKVSGRARTAGRNAQIGGAPGSAHLTDNARDFTFSGDYAQALKRLQADPRFAGYDVRQEELGDPYSTGRHLHIAARPGAKDITFGQSAPAAKPAAAKPTAKPSAKAPAAPAPSGHWYDPLVAGGEYVGSGITDFLTGINEGLTPSAERQRQAASQFKEDITKHPWTPGFVRDIQRGVAHNVTPAANTLWQDLTTRTDPRQGYVVGPTLRAGKTLLDTAGYLASPLGALGEAVVGRPAQMLGLDPTVAGNVAAMAAGARAKGVPEKLAARFPSEEGKPSLISRLTPEPVKNLGRELKSTFNAAGVDKASEQAKYILRNEFGQTNQRKAVAARTIDEIDRLRAENKLTPAQERTLMYALEGDEEAKAEMRGIDPRLAKQTDVFLKDVRKHLETRLDVRSSKEVADAVKEYETSKAEHASLEAERPARREAINDALYERREADRVRKSLVEKGADKEALKAAREKVKAADEKVKASREEWKAWREEAEEAKKRKATAKADPDRTHKKIVDFVDEYFPRRYKNPKKAEAFLKEWRSRSATSGRAGSGRHLIKRTGPSMREALEGGKLELASGDFTENLRGYADEIFGHTGMLGAQDALQESGLAHWENADARLPEGVTRLAGRGTTRKAVAVTNKEGKPILLPAKVLVAPDSVARMYHNTYGARPTGLLPAAAKVLGPVARAATGLKLANPLPHAALMVKGTIGQRFAGAGDALLAGRPAAAASRILDVIKGDASVTDVYSQGKALREAISGGEQFADPMDRQLSKLYVTVGGTSEASPLSEGVSGKAGLVGMARKGRQVAERRVGQGIEQMRTGRRAYAPEGSKPSLLARAEPVVGAARAVLSAPRDLLFKEATPNLKSGAWMTRMRQFVEDNPGTRLDSPEAVQYAMEAHDEIENRMGEMNYQNHFIKPYTAEWLRILGTAPGFDAGTIKMLYKGLIRELPQVVKSAMHLRPSKAPNLTGLAGILAAESAYNMMYQYLLGSGDTPQSAEDIVRPRTGGVDTYGEPARATAAPGYLANFANFAADTGDKGLPASAAGWLGSKANPAFGVAKGVFGGTDYYGNPIRGSGEERPGEAEAMGFMGSTDPRMETLGWLLSGQGAGPIGAGGQGKADQNLPAWLRYLGMQPASISRTSPEQVKQNEEYFRNKALDAAIRAKLKKAAQ